MSELLHCLKEKVWLIGQSLGGIVAQIIAVHHAEVVEGLVLSNTCSLSKAMYVFGNLVHTFVCVDIYTYI